MASQPKAKNAHKVSEPHLADPAHTTSNISLLSTRRKVSLPCVLRKLSRTFQLGEEENADLEQVAAGIDRMIPFSHFQRNLVSRSINQLIVMMHREQQMQQRLTRGMLYSPISTNLFLMCYWSYRHGNVLVCWEHGVLSKIVAALGVTEPVVYPEERFDVIVSLDEV
jgi:hypothetical protein